jgi:hypothetical protein
MRWLISVLLETVSLGVTIEVEGIIFENGWIAGWLIRIGFKFFQILCLIIFLLLNLIIALFCCRLLVLIGICLSLSVLKPFGLGICPVFSVVADAWLDSVVGSPAFSLSRKWKKTKSTLKFWNKHHFGHIQTRKIPNG